MFAVIKTGGKQYRVAKDQVLAVERLLGKVGEDVHFEEVLMIGDGAKTTIGAPLIAGAMVTAEVVEQARGPKLVIFKKRRRKNSRRKTGHRQDLTKLRIVEILTEGQKPAVREKKAAPTEKPAAKSKSSPRAKVKTADKKPATKKTAAKKTTTKKTATKKTAGKKAPAKKAAAKKTAGKKTAAKKSAAKKTKE